jgi:hypothetical protein
LNESKSSSDAEKKLEPKETDIPLDVDLFFKTAHLLQLEEHSYFEYLKTGDERFKKLWLEFRERRIANLNDLIKGVQLEKGSEGWCIWKHLLGLFYRSLECESKRHEESIVDARLAFSVFEMLRRSKKVQV